MEFDFNDAPLDEIHFTVLGSGSTGNASLLEVGEFGLLIDAGLGPRQIASRLKTFGKSWDEIDAAILTHVHADHWKDSTLHQFLQRDIRLHLHQEHLGRMRDRSLAFPSLEERRLIRLFDVNAPNPLGSTGLTVRPFRVSHDAGATFGFRFDLGGDGARPVWSMTYAADLGVWREDQLRHFCDVDLLALEFNHDVALQKASDRPMELIARVLGDEGHLSNIQAAALLERLLSESPPQRLKNLVQLHLSRDCNRPDLAFAAAHRVLQAAGCSARVQTADHQRPVAVRVVRPTKKSATTGLV